MTTISANSDVWVIHKEEALLYRQQGQTWALESRMSYADFHGSGVALASFTLADTCVFLNVEKTEYGNNSSDQLRWLGIEQDPLRMNEFPHSADQAQLLRKLRIMGKQPAVIAISDPAQFVRAPKLFLANQQEAEHLKGWVRSQTNGTSKGLATAQLFLSLWAKPGQQQQKLRLVALVCTALAVAAMQWATAQQMRNHDILWKKSIQEGLERQITSTDTVSFESWFTQIKKFGQGNRANLSSLSIHWSNSGKIYSVAQLDRDRKRAPKGCTLVTSNKAECVSQRIEK